MFVLECHKVHGVHLYMYGNIPVHPCTLTARAPQIMGYWGMEKIH